MTHSHRMLTTLVLVLATAAVAGGLFLSSVLTTQATPGTCATPTNPITPLSPETPGAGSHDAKLRRISVSHAALSGEDFACKALKALVRNEGDHGPETIGVYMDVIPPGGTTTSNPFGCLPNGRILETSISVGQVSAPLETIDVYAVDGTLNGAFRPANDPIDPDNYLTFSCANLAGAAGEAYEIFVVVDIHGDDLDDCPAGSLISQTCLDALADDDPDKRDNDKSVPFPRVVGP